MKNIVLISASPKVAKPSLSQFFIERIENKLAPLAMKIDSINIRQSLAKNSIQEGFMKLVNADAVIIAFPLYFFCLPGILTRFLQDYYTFALDHENRPRETKVYAVINCGFPEPGINSEATRVIQSFCRHLGIHFRFAVLIGGGGMLQETKDAPFMKKTFAGIHDSFSRIIEDIQSGDCQETPNICISPKFPKWLYFFMGNRGWVSAVRKNGLKKKDLYRKPY